MKIKDDVLAILSKTTVDGNTVYLNCGQLERKMYMDVNKVLESMGGKWNRKAKGHVFDDDPNEKLEAILLSGEYDKPADFGFFPTPDELVMKMIDYADLKYGMTVLEPSAGTGAIAYKVKEITGSVDCFELQEKNCQILQKMGIMAECCDFLTVEAKPLYDRVVMNPPFAKQQDIDHVTHALKAVKPGGKLVSIMSSGITFRQNRKTIDFLSLIEGHSKIINNPPNSFKLSGTAVNTIMLIVDKRD